MVASSSILVTNLGNREKLFISKYIQRFERKREVPVWEDFEQSVGRSRRKCLCSCGIPVWNAVFHFGDRFVRSRTGKENGLSEVPFGEPVRRFSCIRRVLAARSN